MSEEVRNRILAAAARVYTQHGFRGATTRLIATEAGVNEVTLFRTFGSKADLLQAMLQSHVTATSAPMIETDLSDPEGALTAWCSETLEYLRGHAHFIRKTIAEAEERPDAACAACEGPSTAARSLVIFAERLREAGLADPDADMYTAISMLMSALFGDALYRGVMPHSFPQPGERAAALYVGTFLRSIGYRAATRSAQSTRRVAAGGRRRDRS